MIGCNRRVVSPGITVPVIPLNYANLLRSSRRRHGDHRNAKRRRMTHQLCDAADGAKDPVNIHPTSSLCPPPALLHVTQSWYYPPEDFYRRRLCTPRTPRVPPTNSTGSTDNVRAQRIMRWRALLSREEEDTSSSSLGAALDAVHTRAQLARYPYKHLLRAFYVYFCGDLSPEAQVDASYSSSSSSVRSQADLFSGKHTPEKLSLIHI